MFFLLTFSIIIYYKQFKTVILRAGKRLQWNTDITKEIFKKYKNQLFPLLNLHF